MRIFLPIAKVDTESRMVYGYASTEARDDQGEIVTKTALDGALGDYMKFANIREMHQLSAVGTAKEAAVDDKGLYVAAKIIDPRAWEKVKSGVYKGFSIGGKVKERNPSDPKTITALNLDEISLVDRPANPEAVFDCWKRSALADAETAIAGIVKALGAAETAIEKGGNEPGDGSKPYGDEDYADPGYQSDKQKRYPLTEGGKPSETRIRAAWNYIHKKKNAGKYSAEHLKSIKDKIIAAWKKHIDKDGPPGADDGKKAIEAMLRKSLGTVGRAACAAQELHFLAHQEGIEKEMEGDDSPQAARLKAIVADLIAWCQDGLAEAAEEIKDGGEVDGTLVVNLSAAVSSLQKGTEPSAELLAALRKAAAGMDGTADTHSTADTGRNAEHAAPHPAAPAGPANPEANSTVDTEPHAQAIHDHAVKMGAKCAGGVAMAAGAGDDLAKVQAERDTLAKTLVDLAPRVEALGKRVEELAQQPLPPETIARGSVRIRKGQETGDGGAPELSDEQATALWKSMTPEQQTMLLIKAAPRLSTPAINALAAAPMPRAGR